MMNKICVITALSGNKERLYDPGIVFPNVDYYAFVDTYNPECKVWKQKILPDFTIDIRYKNRRNSKIIKILPHLFVPDYSVYFWTDVSHELIMNPEEVIDTYLKDKDIALFKHTTRNCIYEEAKELIKLGYDVQENIERAVQFYKGNGYPANNGLYELPVSVRKNSDKIQEMNLAWWEIICRFSSRDQISLPYVLWSHGIDVSMLPGRANGHNSDGSIGCNNILKQVRQHVSSGP
jgi:hypothetical protein